MRRLDPLLFATMLGAAVSVGCKDAVSPRPPTVNVAPVEGLGQTAERLDTLPQTLVVRVVDDEGRPVARVALTWSISDPDGRFVTRDSTTDGDGRARATVILGFVPGIQAIEVRAQGFDDVARFTATATSASGFKAVALKKHSGSDDMCAIDVEGRAWCWGHNSSGELGYGSLEHSEAPRMVATSERFKDLWGSGSTTCGLSLADKLLCWGHNHVGESGRLFGNGSLEYSTVPVPAGGGLSFRAFDIGSTVACGVTLTGEAYCWGSGALGNGTAHSESAVPIPLSGGGTWREIVTDDRRGCVVSEVNEVYCWAAEDPLETIGIDAASVFVPAAVPIVPPLSGLSIGYYNQCGVGSSGYGAVCWGEWTFAPGGLDPPGPDFPRPEGESFARILAKSETIMGLSPSGRLWIWGRTPSVHDGWISDTPVAMKPAGPWLDFAIGSGPFGIHASDSTVWRWPVDAFGHYFERDGGHRLPVPVPAPVQHSDTN
jgi:hypothetical protein